MLEERSARKRHVFARALLTTCSLSQVRPFDPFEILGVTHGATEKDIKRAYRQLSLKFHPDKVRTCFAVALRRLTRQCLSEPGPICCQLLRRVHFPGV